MKKQSEKLSQLKKLSAIKADDSWVYATKHELLSEIDSQNRLMKANQLSVSEKMDMYFSRLLSNVVPTFSRVIAGFLIVAMGSGFSMAAQASVPGQALWPVKRSIEKVELSLATSPVKETEIHMKHINKRLDEIEKILKDKNDSPEKEKALKQAVSHLEKDIKSADISLKVVQAEKTASETMALAKKVKEKVKETTDNVIRQVQDSHDASAKEVVDKVSEVNEDVKDSVVNLAIEVHEGLIQSGAVDAVDISDVGEEVVEEENKNSSLDSNKADGIYIEEVKVIENIVKEFIAEEIADLETDIQESQESKDLLLNRVRVVDRSGEIIVRSEEVAEEEFNSEGAELKVGEAKTLLEEGSLKDAVEKISEGKEIQKKAKKALETMEEATEVIEKEAQEAAEEKSVEDLGAVESEEVPVEEATEVEASAIKLEEAILEEDNSTLN